MRKVVIFSLVFALLLCGCSAPESEQVVDVTAAEPAAEETEPAPDNAEPAAEPESVPEPTPVSIAAPVTYTGSGDDVVEIAPYPETLYVFEISGNEAESNFIITTYTDSGDRGALLVNTLDKYHGITMDDDFNVGSIEVKAEGDWTIVQRSMYDMDVMTAGQTYSGSGDRIVLVSGGGSTASITGNEAETNFIVRMFNAQGRSSLLVNELGKYEGKVMAKDPIIFEVKAVGDWSIALD